MKKTLLLFCFFSVYAWIVGAQTTMTCSISTTRVKEIASLLPDSPEGIGVTYKDRDFWDKVTQMDEAQKLLDEAFALSKQGIPPFIDSLYLHLNATNIRLPGENMMNARYSYISCK